MEEKSTLTILNKRTKKLETINIHTGEIVSTQGELATQYVYSIELSEAIANLVRSGDTLRKISEMDNMPQLFILYNWRNAHPEFKAKLKQARKDRAFYFEDRAIEAVEEAEGASRDDIAALKMQFDGYSKLAEKGNPEQFAAKPQVLHGGGGPATIVIHTGIHRDSTTEIEVNNEKICISGRPESGVRRVYEEAERTRVEERKGFGAEVEGLPDVRVEATTEESSKEEI